MARPLHQISLLLCAALVPGCPSSDPGDATHGAATTATTSTTGSLSGSSTSASDSAPTMATAPLTGSGSGGSTGEPCTFLGCDDYPKPECDVWAQDCPEGQKCAAVISNGGGAWDAVKCVDVIGTDKPGEPCTMEDVASGVDSCIEGAMCWDVQDGVGYCVAQCIGDPEAPSCENKSSCTISGDGVILLCLLTCHPLLQNCPDPDLGCYPVDDSFFCVPDASSGEGQANEPCEFINVCGPGLMCADTGFVGMGCPEGSAGCCTPFCKFPDGACPNPDQQCVQYFDPMILPLNDPKLDIGFCGIPI